MESIKPACPGCEFVYGAGHVAAPCRHQIKAALLCFRRAMRRHERRALRMGARLCRRDIAAARIHIGAEGFTPVAQGKRVLIDPMRWFRWSAVDNSTGAYLLERANDAARRYLAAVLP